MSPEAQGRYQNPFRPGSGHMPPHLAGRLEEREEFGRLLDQEVILENLVLTGLRGVGKTVLLDTFRPLAARHGWLWAGADLSEAASITEDRICTRMITDLAVAVSGVQDGSRTEQEIGFARERREIPQRLDYATMAGVFDQTPGLASDKLRAVLELVWAVVEHSDAKGLVLAYDEAQNMSDHSADSEYPLSLMLDLFQSIQKKGMRLLLVLTGLPTLFPKLVEARTYSERMFRVRFLDRLGQDESREAIVQPLSVGDNLVSFDDASVDLIVDQSGGYPYFLQFMCREAYDVFARSGHGRATVPVDDILRKLDTDFFAGRWAKATDRQRDLLHAIADLSGSDNEFTVQDVARHSKAVLDKGFSPSHAGQMFQALQESGLIYKNRHGKYSFAVPLLGRFVLRQRD